MKSTLNVSISLLLLVLTACSPLSTPPVQNPAARQATPVKAQPAAVAAATAGAEPLPDADEAKPVLLFGIGLHIEPHGSTPSALAVGSAASRPEPKPAQAQAKPKPDYHNPVYFQRSTQDIAALAEIIEAHHGVMTVQAQTPFTQMAIDENVSLLADLARQGHEMALHFHEDAHLGKDGASLPVETWCAVMKEEIALVQQASGVSQIRYWSGGNLYPDLFEAAACAGLDVNSDWKNPQTQSTPAELIGVTPWRPSGGSDGQDFSRLLTHDPNGQIVFLPEASYRSPDAPSKPRQGQLSEEEAYFIVLEDSLNQALAIAQPGQVNVFHLTLHPGEFRGDPAAPFAVIERFLTEVVDPLVAGGQVQWATFSAMADAYQALEQAGQTRLAPGAAPASEPVQPTATACPAENCAPVANTNGYISFIINVHDWVHPTESADTLLRLVDLFEANHVRGDFYFTAPVVQAYQRERPDVIERLKNSAMTISYHIRPPHPLYSGFNQHLQAMSDSELEQTLLDYETYALDLATGELDRSQPGGYSYVAQVFGRKPVTASAPTGEPRLRRIAQSIYARLGAQATVLYHETGTDPQQPFEFVQDLLVRPSDFSVTRVTSIDGSDNFWWNRMIGEQAPQYAPLTMLQSGLADWQAGGNTRLPYITSLIHENNFVRSGPEGWTGMYYSLENRLGNSQKTAPLDPPYDLSAPDPSRVRNQAEQDAIWQAYAALVAWAAANMQVITSADLQTLAAQ